MIRFLFWKIRFTYNYLRSKFICINQYCKRCGKSYPIEVWTTTNEIWEKVCGGEKNYCLSCFNEMAREKGINLLWTISEYSDYRERK